MKMLLETGWAMLRRRPDIWFPLAMIAVGTFAIGFALTAEYGFGLLPCILCLYQRVPYVLGILFGVTALAFRHRDWALPGMLVASIVAFTVNAGLGAFHVGVEHHWWAGPNTCSANDLATNLEVLRTQMMQQTEVVPCDVVAWSLFGISFAGYNFLLSLALIMFCILGLWIVRTNGAAPSPKQGHSSHAEISSR